MIINVASFSLNIGDENIENFEIPDEWKIIDICSKIYGNNLTENDVVVDRVILSGHNENIHKINKKNVEQIIFKLFYYYVKKK